MISWDSGKGRYPTGGLGRGVSRGGTETGCLYESSLEGTGLKTGEDTKTGMGIENHGHGSVLVFLSFLFFYL